MAQNNNNFPSSIATPIPKLRAPSRPMDYVSLAHNICTIENMQTPVALAHSLTYSFNVNNVRGTQIITTEKVITFSDNKTITSNGKTAKVLFISGNNVLIQSEKEFLEGDVLNEGGKIVSVYTNLYGQSPSLADFGRADVGTNANSEINKAIDYRIVSKVLNTNNNSRKIKATLTQEAYQDMLAMYGNNKNDLHEVLKKYMLLEVNKGIDIDIVNNIKKRASLVDKDLDIKGMYQGGVYDVPAEIVATLSEVIDGIALRTTTPPEIFVLGSPNVIKHIATHGSLVEGNEEYDSEDIFFRGKLFGWRILSDVTGASLEDYLIVGTLDSTILGMYKELTFEATPDEDGNMTFFCLVQYDIQGTPLDTEGEGKSQFLRKFKVINTI